MSDPPSQRDSVDHVIIMTSLIFPPFTKMAFSEEEKHVTEFLRQNKHHNIMKQTDFLKSFLIKNDLVVDWIRLFARLFVLEFRNVFPAVAVRALHV